jgi:hypothetical protein
MDILLAVFFLLSSYAGRGVLANPATLLHRQLLGDPNLLEQQRPSDPQPNTPVTINPIFTEPVRSLNTCRDFTIESAVLYASCSSAIDGTDTSPSVNLNDWIKNEFGKMIYEAE